MQGSWQNRKCCGRPAFCEVVLPACVRKFLEGAGTSLAVCALAALGEVRLGHVTLVPYVHAAPASSASGSPLASSLEEHRLADEMWQIVNNYYVDGNFNGTNWNAVREDLRTARLTSRANTYRAVRNALSRLKDVYTRVLTPDDMASLRKFDVSGVGVLLTEGPNETVVVAIDPPAESEAFQAGVKKGDTLESVDGKQLRGVDSFQVAELMSGKEGSDVSLKFSKAGEVKLKRHYEEEASGSGKEKSVTLHIKDNEGIAFIRIRDFRAATRGEVAAALEEVNSRGIKKVAVDLRGNPGGVFEGALEIAALFDGGKARPVAKVSARNAEEQLFKSVKLSSDNVTLPSDAQVALLLDRKSASASEVLAGGLRDNCDAVIVGDSNSYGKGLVQGVFPLSDGGGIVVTVAKYVTPNGLEIQGKGIPPDVPLHDGPQGRLSAAASALGITEIEPHVDFDKVAQALTMCKAKQ